jgi:sialic acid synthase SpsE
MKIGNKKIAIDKPTLFIADIAANHDGSLNKALDLINLSAESGANAAKFQNFTASTIVSDYGFRKLQNHSSHQSNWKKSVSEVYNDASIPLEWAPLLKEECLKVGMDYFTSPYDIGLLDYLSKYVAAWKIGSGDITWHEAIVKMSSYNLPLFVAAGASNMKEVIKVMELLDGLNADVCLMQCNTNYTASLENFKFISLNVLKAFAKKFPNVILGLSDHTPGHATVLGAIALGARVIEKHYTDNNLSEGPDHKFSMKPNEWKDMVERSRELELALGTEEKKVMGNELETVVIQRRSIRAAKIIKKGGLISLENIAFLRPCPVNALEPYKVNDIINKKVNRDIPLGDLIYLEDLI